jgi:uncharacterized membrane protein
MSLHHRIAAAALFALAALQIAWYGWWSPPVSIGPLAAISFALIWFALPLAFARQSTERGLLVGALVALLYFSHGVMQCWVSRADRAPALIEIALSVIVIAFAGWPAWTRMTARRRQSAAPRAD